MGHGSGLDSASSRWLQANQHKLPRMSRGRNKLTYLDAQSLEYCSTRQPSDVYVKGAFAIEISKTNPLVNPEYGGPQFPHLQWVHGPAK